MSEERPKSAVYDSDETPARLRASRERLEQLAVGEVVELAAQLLEVQRHREWLLASQAQHVDNVQEELARAITRVGELEAHASNLENERDEARADARHLREMLAGRDAHQANLERDRDEALADARNLRAMLAGRDAHRANLERARDEAVADARNLRDVATALEARLADLDAHVRNLERRLPRRRARLGEGRMFPESPDPRTDALFREGERILASRADLQERFGEDAAADFWYWLLWHGPRHAPALEPLLPPIPDAHLIGRVVGEQTDADGYRHGGLVDWWSIDGSLRRAGFDPTRGGRILDFGCGCGRLLGLFSLYADRCELHGADVDAEAIEWCRENLPVARFTAIDQMPPTDFPDACFDAIYSFSVFSHLPEQRHLEWLAELARVARPGASLVITIQGEAVARRLGAAAAERRFPTPRDLEARMPELADKGFLFLPYRRLRFHDRRNRAHFAEWDLEAYGDTFILEEYVRERWSEWFDVVDLVLSPDEWQDHVLLRRR